METHVHADREKGPMELRIMTALYSEGFTGNALLDAVPPRDRARLPLVDVPLSVGQVLCECEQPVNWAYFPTSCVVSCFYTTRDGTTAETALIGNDGMFSVALFLAGGRSSARAVVQVAGDALRVSPRALQAEFGRAGAVQQVLLGYTDRLLTQISQTAICNRLHPLQQRLCRWLLLCQDRLGRDEFLITQELMANLLGGRRESVTVAAGHLQELGALRYSRGRVTIINRQLLEQRACECYGVLRSRLAVAKGLRSLYAVKRPSRPEGDDEASSSVA
jgi:CRP-like cAMP-binding protein